MLLRLFLSLALVTTAPAIALACGNAMLLDGDDAVQQIAHAEKLLARGKLSKARRLVEPMRYRFKREGLRRRARLVLAGTIIRQAKPSRHRLPYVLRQLEGALEKNEDNPQVIARLAEGYALSQETRDRAREMLKDLSDRDLMPDAFGYRTLGRLLTSAGQPEEGAVAMKRCRKMTKRKEVCTLSRKNKKRKRKSKAAARS